MNLKQLEAFVYVADSRSFSKAAKDLYLTQPTVSAHIAALEKELNARVFVRNTKEVGLSESGQKLYKYAKKMIELERTIEQEFRIERSKKSECVTIAASTIPARYLLPGIMLAFREKHPEQQFKIVELDSARVVEELVSNIADIGFTGTVMEKKHCRYIPFYRDELIIITANQERFRERLKKSPDDITWFAEEPVIMREEGSGTRREAHRQLYSQGIEMDKLNVVATMDNPETIKKSVEKGIGVSVISRLAAAEELEEGKLLAFPLFAGADGRDINIVYNKNFRLSASADRLIKMVRKLYSA